MSVGLGRIGVHGDAPAGADGAQLPDRLDHPNLIVGHHHAHQLGVGLDGLLQLLHLDQAVLLRSQQRDLKSLFLQPHQGVEHGVMLTGHADQMPWPSVSECPCPGVAEQRQVVGLCGTTGENQLLGTDPQAARKTLSG